MWLSDEDVERLTGYKLAAYQRRWLEQQRIRHRVNARGKVIVAQNDVLGTRKADAAPPPKRFSFETA